MQWFSPGRWTQCLPQTERSLEVAGGRKPERDSVKVLSLEFQNSKGRSFWTVKKGSQGGLCAARGEGGSVGRGRGPGLELPGVEFRQNLTKWQCPQGGKVVQAPTANGVWQGRCCAAKNLRKERRNRSGVELVVVGFRFVECAPDSGYWLEVQLLESGGGHLF